MRLPQLSTTLLFIAPLLGFPIALATGSSDDLPEWKPDPNAERAAIPEVYQWKLGRLFESEAAFEQSLEALGGQVKTLERFRGKLAEPRSLRDALKLYFALHNGINRLTLYSSLVEDTDSSSAKYQGMSSRALALMDELMKQASTLRGEMLALSEESLARAYADPNGPAEYRDYLDGLRRRKSRLLESDAERVLALLGDNLWAEIDLNEIPSPSQLDYSAMITDIEWPIVHDAEGNEVRLSLSGYPPLRRDPDRGVRREAVEAFLATMRQYSHVFAATLGGQAAFTVNLARARNYDTALEAYLDKDELDPAVYHTLIDTVNANTELLHRYVRLRKKALGLDEVRLYDLYIPLVENVESHISYTEARETILTALEPLGEEYLSILGKGLDLENGWIDLFPHQGKRSGAYCASVYGEMPFVCMNYQDSLDDMSTLAHEFGHAMHSIYSMRSQTPWEFNYAPFLAEIASTTNEVLLQDHLLANATDDRVKAMLLTDRLEGIKGTIFRQTQFAEFELAVHTFVEQGTPVTADLLEKTYLDLLRRYYGPDYTIGPNDGLEWAYIRHFYYKYYVFAYATGLSSGIALARRVQQGEAERDALISFLSAGSSEPPLEILRKAGVDLTRPDAIQAAMDVFAETLDELETLLPKLK